MCLAIPGQIVELFPEQPTAAMIDVVGVRRRIDLGLLQDNMPVMGDWVLIHVGFAMSKINAEEAASALSALRMMGQGYDDELEALLASRIAERERLAR